MDKDIVEHSADKENDESRIELLEEYKVLKEENAELDKELAKFKDNDPVKIELKSKYILRLLLNLIFLARKGSS